MALTYATLQNLRGQNLEKLFNDHKELWREQAKTAYRTYAGLLTDEKPRIDDVAKALSISLEIDTVLREALQKKNLRAKKWIEDFGDLILDRVWSNITRG